MRIRVEAPGGARTWVVEAPEGSTLGSLARLVGLPRASLVAVDGTAHPVDEPVAACGATDGSTLAPAWGETVVLGLVDVASGRRWRLAPGRRTLGRHPSVDVLVDDPGVGGLHAELDVDPTGWVHVRPRSPAAEPCTLVAGDHLVAGTTRLTVVVEGRAAAVADGTAPARAVVHNRPPRDARPPAPIAPATPDAVPPPSPGASARTLVSLLVPSLTGVALSAVLRPDMVPFALLAPAGALITWAVLRVLDRQAARRHTAAVTERDAAHDAAWVAHGAAVAAHLTARHAPPVEVARRICAADPRLWERRPAHEDFLVVAAGRGRVQVADRVVHGDDRTGVAVDAPVELDLVHPVGIVGSADDVRALARSLVLHLAAHHGPADLALDAWTTDHFAWRWMHWLPHTTGCVVQHADVEPDADLRSPEAPGARRLVVVDADGLPARWRTAWTGLLAHGTALVLAPHERALPEQCRTTVAVEGGRATVRDHASGRVVTVDDLWCMEAPVADALAARLARVHDPDAVHRRVPSDPSLLALLAGPAVRDELRACDAVRARWATARTGGACVAPIGEDASGTVAIDLVADGPHALVAGTTGSGKSELLRALVLGFAASVDPQHLAFVLVDYKGGSAFDGLASLPHVVDVVTDLDVATAARAVRGLEAAVLRRERVLRAAGATDIAALHRADGLDEPLPRLVIVVDEFATLAQELPAFVDELVDVAQRGRSLGVHLVLATQRPSGAVKDSIRTNTNLRIALRVVDVHDSRDVVGVDTAAAISRGERGRALVRLGAGELRTVQVAHTGRRVRPVCATLTVSPFGMTEVQPAPDAPTELDLLVAAIVRAHGEEGGPAPRRPWTDPLPAPLPLADARRVGRGSGSEDVNGRGRRIVLGLTDDQDAQHHGPFAWYPDEGNLLVAGLAGSGATDALAACVAGAVDAAAGTHVYVVSAMPAAFSWCAAMTAVGAVIDPGDDERVRRLLATLGDVVRERRRADDASPRPPVLLLVDGVGVLRSVHDTPAGLEVLEQLERLAADGPAVGVHLAFVAEHPGALGHRLDRTVTQRVLLRLADRADLLALGVRDLDPASLPRGRGVDAATGALVQLAHLDDASMQSAIDADRAASAAGAVPAPSIGALPEQLDAARLGPAWLDERDVLHVPLGIGDQDLAPAGLALRAGAHALVVGAAGTGKTALLDLVRDAVAAAGIAVLRIGRSDATNACADDGDVDVDVDALLAARERTVVVVDDADVAGGDALERLLVARPAHVHVVAAARGDRLRPLFRHWTTDLRRSGHAVLLRGDDADAELVGVRLPRRTGPWPPGRGWLVRDGAVERCQFAIDGGDRAGRQA